MGEGPAVNGRREGLRSKCYGSLFPSECHCQRVPSHRDVSPPRQLPQGGTSVGERLHWHHQPVSLQWGPWDVLSSHLKSLTIPGSWPRQDPTPVGYCANTYGECPCARHCVFGDTALGLLNKKENVPRNQPQPFRLSNEHFRDGSRSIKHVRNAFTARKRLKTKNKQLRGNERKQKQCREERSSSKTLSWGLRSAEPFHPWDNSRRAF